MSDHTDFLYSYTEPGEHYSLNDHPFGFEGKIPTKDVLDVAVNHPLVRIRKHAATHPSANQEHLDKLMHDPEVSVVSAIASRPDLTQARMDQLVDHPTGVVTYHVINSQMMKLAPHHIEKFLNHDDSSMRVLIARHPNLSAEQVGRLAHDQNAYVRSAAAVHPNLSKADIAELSKDDSLSVRASLLYHPSYR